MLTVEQIGEKIRQLHSAPVSRENYKQIALLIHPFVWIDERTITEEIVEKHLDSAALSEHETLASL